MAKNFYKSLPDLVKDLCKQENIPFNGKPVSIPKKLFNDQFEMENGMMKKTARHWYEEFYEKGIISDEPGEPSRYIVDINKIPERLR